MFCSHCGTRVIATSQRVCQECGRTLTISPNTSGQDSPSEKHGYGPNAPFWTSPPATPPFQRLSVLYVQGRERGAPLKTALMVVGLLLLLPLAIPLFFGTLILGAVLLAAVAHLVPLLVLGGIVYWFLTRQRHTIRL